jgi:hypothetical protein
VLARTAVRPDPTVRAAYSATVFTDEKGQWLSPPLVDSTQVYLQLEHPDYVADNSYHMDYAPLDELRSGIATIVMKK